jgi:hypothetical protein
LDLGILERVEVSLTSMDMLVLLRLGLRSYFHVWPNFETPEKLGARDLTLVCPCIPKLFSSCNFVLRSHCAL